MLGETTPFGEQSSDQERLSAAIEEIQALLQRVHELEEELSSSRRRDNNMAGPRLPSLRSIVQPELGVRLGYSNCPTCGLPRAPPAGPTNDTLRLIYDNSTVTGRSPSSTSAASDLEPLTAKMTPFPETTLRTTGSIDSNASDNPSPIGKAPNPRAGPLTATLPRMQVRNTPEKCYPCRLRNLPVCFLRARSRKSSFENKLIHTV